MYKSWKNRSEISQRQNICKGIVCRNVGKAKPCTALVKTGWKAPVMNIYVYAQTRFFFIPLCSPSSHPNDDDDDTPPYYIATRTHTQKEEIIYISNLHCLSRSLFRCPITTTSSPHHHHLIRPHRSFSYVAVAVWFVFRVVPSP